VRISLGRYTSESEIRIGCNEIIATVSDLKAKLGLQANVSQTARGAGV